MELAAPALLALPLVLALELDAPAAAAAVATVPRVEARRDLPCLAPFLTSPSGGLLTLTRTMLAIAFDDQMDFGASIDRQTNYVTLHTMMLHKLQIFHFDPATRSTAGFRTAARIEGPSKAGRQPPNTTPTQQQNTNTPFNCQLEPI